MPAKNALQTLQSEALTGEWDLLHNVLPHKPIGRVHVALVDHFLNEASNHCGSFLGAQLASLQKR
jgi:hypothetical protein